MTSNDLIKRLIDAGLSFTQMSQAKAEEIAKDLQEAGQLRVDEAQATVQDLMARGRENTENLMRLIQREVSKQLETMGVDLSDLEARVEDLAARIGIRAPGGGSSASAGASSAATTGTAKKSTAKKSPAKRSTAKKTAAKKTAAKKTTAKRAPAKRSTAKKSTAKKTAAKKTTAKKAASR
jgi:polyhydroxyalkanoate synthesis regulator phasin